MKKIGVFCCWCGSNIAEVVNIDRLVNALAKYPGVVHCDNYTYFCSEVGQKLVRDMIKEKKLDGIVIAACSPAMHEATFRRAAERAGLNYYQCEIANIREQCSWVHRLSKEEATEKAIKLVQSMVEKLKQNENLEPISSSLTKRALVIGGGIGGMQAALEIANCGYEVILLERQPSIGGHMAQLAETFPTLDCSQCILTPKMVEVAQHPKIKLMTYSELEAISGYVGNFKVKIKKKATYVDWAKCTSCGLCWQKCPLKVSSEFECGLGERKAIYVVSPQAVPNKPVIHKEDCLYLLEKKCGVCKKICEVGAINYEDENSFLEEEVGAIVVATGYELYPKAKIGEYGYGVYKNVIDSLQFERLMSASGPTTGKIERPSDGKVPEEVVFIQCVASRDPEKGVSYCSRICCLYSTKHALLYKRRVPQGQAYVFYIDIRAGGKAYEEFIQKAIQEEKLLYLRGKVSKVFQEGEKLVVWGEDTLAGKKIEVRADLVVLALAMIPRDDAKELAKLLNVSTNQYGFFNEAHVKLRPVECQTRGIFLAGCAQAPRDIPDTIAQAGSAASKVIALFSADRIKSDPIVACVDEEICAGCGICVTVCPYDAREIDEITNVAKVKEVLCQGCGACVAACPNKASQLKNMTTSQIISMIDALQIDVEKKDKKDGSSD